MPFIYTFYHTTGKQVRTHVVSSKIIKNCITQQKPTTRREEESPPPRKTTVERLDQWGKGRDGELCGGEWQSEVGLREGGDGAPKGGSHPMSIIVADMHGDEA
jgi:hypothetical protein